MKEAWGILALTWWLAAGCSSSNGTGADLGSGGGDLLGGGQDQGSTGPRGLALLAGQVGGPGNLDGTGAAARLDNPGYLTVDGAGNVYVADTVNNLVRKIVAATGQVTTLAGSPGMAGGTDGVGPAASFNNPYSVAADGAGNVYVADTQGGTIRKIVAATGAVTTLAGTYKVSGSMDGIGAAASFYAPQYLALDGAGNLYVTDAVGTVRKIALATAAVTTEVGVAGQHGVMLGPFPASLNFPRGLAMVPNQGLAISDNNENVILLAHGL